MTDLLKALHTFWSSFVVDGRTVAAYEQNSVPDGAELPYITYEVRRPESLRATNTAAIFWSKGTGDEAGINAEMAVFSDQVSRAIPNGGADLKVGNGSLALYRPTGGDFISIIADAAQTDRPGRVLGLRVGYEPHFYMM